MRLIADEKIIFTSPDPAEIFCYTPGLCLGFPGKHGRERLIAACDFGGPGIRKLDGPTSPEGDSAGNQIRVKYSDDGGETWTETETRLPFRHEILFRAGKCLYMIGNDKRLVISRSDDNGETWSAPAILDDQQQWHQSCTAVDRHEGKVTLVYEIWPKGSRWPVSISPVLMAAEESDDLTKRSAWRFSGPWDSGEEMAKAKEIGFLTANPGILETNVVRIHDPGHPFFDPSGRSVALLMRVHSGLRNIGAFLMGRRSETGELTIGKAKTAEGSGVFLLPLPGGNMKFHIQYDSAGKMYWMVASQTDGIHSDRRRLGLYYSRTLLEWNFAGMIAAGPCESGSRHYATMVIDGDDIFVLSRSGDERAKNAHDNNFQTFHRIRNFRSLIG